MPYKDKTKPEIKARTISILKERWDMFDDAKKKREREFGGKISNGGYLEYLIILDEYHTTKEEREKINKINMKNKTQKQIDDVKKCAMECETLDEFAEKCGKLINEQTNFTAQEAWDEFCSQYNDG